MLCFTFTPLVNSRQLFAAEKAPINRPVPGAFSSWTDRYLSLELVETRTAKRRINISLAFVWILLICCVFLQKICVCVVCFADFKWQDHRDTQNRLHIQNTLQILKRIYGIHKYKSHNIQWKWATLNVLPCCFCICFFSFSFCVTDFQEFGICSLFATSGTSR